MEKTIKELIKLAEDFKNLSQKYNSWICQDYYFQEGEKEFLLHCYFSEDFNPFVALGKDVLPFMVKFSYYPRVEFSLIEGNIETILKEILEGYKKFYNQLQNFNNKLKEIMEKKKR